MNKFNRYIIFVLVGLMPFYYIPSCSQNTSFSEWEKQIRYAANDTIKLDLLNKAAKKLINFYHSQSRKYANEALIIATRYNNKKIIADCNTIYGQDEFYNGNYPQALGFYIKAQALYTELDNKKGIADVYNLLAVVYHFQGPASFYIVESYNKLAIKIQEKIDDKEGLINSYFNLGELYMDDISQQYFKPDTSLIYFNKALELANTIKNDFYLGNIYSSIGKTYTDLQNYEQAFNYLNKALYIHEKINNNTGIIFANYRLANVYGKVGEYNKAVSFDLKALNLAEKTRNLDLINNICEDLSGLYVSLNDYKKALSYYKQSVETKFQLYNQERIARIAEYQTKYETVKKEKEIILLNKDKEIQRVDLLKKESEIKKRQILQNAFIFGFVLVLIIAIIAYRAYKNKKTANLLLAKQKKEILEKNSLLFQQKEEITSQRDEIEKKNNILKEAYNTIETKTNKITSSISYALKIQQAILPTEENRNKLFPNSFVLFLPKDIVSGDFYWFDQKDNKHFFSAIDCTGHGVPGAFMSMLAYNLLDQALNEYHLTKPSEILNYLNNKLREKLHSNISEDTLRDGMDISLCTYNTGTMVLEYAGVHHPLYVIRNKEIIILNPDVFSIGKNFTVAFSSFTNHMITLEKNDIVYLFSDGYYDQFNEANNKKFTRKRFKDTLIEIADNTMGEQQKELYRIFEEWKGKGEQIDDILVIGIKI